MVGSLKSNQKLVPTESKNITKEQLDVVMQRSTNFILKLCRELCSRLPSNMAMIEKIEYFHPNYCINLNERPTFGELPLEMAGNFIINFIDLKIFCFVNP